MAAKRGWEHFAHGADVGVCGWGPSLAAAFEEAGAALSEAVTRAPIAPQTAVEIACQAPTNELLFVEWLNAIIYEMAVRRMIFGRYAVDIRDSSLQATAWGEVVEPKQHQPACEPKAATLTSLAVGKDREGTFKARCVVDV
jgi:tRNA nucleotidyltransferase (CCA-adding enzyme)